MQLKGKGQMHKSTGSSVTGVDALRITPASVMNYIVLRVNPNRHIDYDAGLGILDMVDEYDRVENMYYCGGCEERDRDLLRGYELSQPEGPRSKLPLQVPYRHRYRWCRSPTASTACSPFSGAWAPSTTPSPLRTWAS